MSAFSNVPNEIAADIFQYIPGNILYKLKEVSTAWKNLIETHQSYLPTLFISGTLTFDELPFQVKTNVPVAALTEHDLKDCCFRRVVLKIPRDIDGKTN